MRRTALLACLAVTAAKLSPRTTASAKAKAPKASAKKAPKTAEASKEPKAKPAKKRRLAGPRRRKPGLLLVGIGGNNGCTMLAGAAANALNLQWEGVKKRCSADWTGCITQTARMRKRGLADFADAELGGWDVRPTPIGQALRKARILDFDLVRQLEDVLDAVPVWPGVYDPRFVGESQREQATHIKQLPDASSKVQALRADIRAFLQKVDGHTTVVWSGSVEPPSLLPVFETSEDLLNGLETHGADFSPSLLYAIAAALEGCSFVNAASQDTVCPGLCELAEKHGAYCLGTDFKAGQTKCKTAIVEYLENLNFNVKVVASSNHLGNNDMKNLALSGETQEKARNAKLRVKAQIFASDIDHHVAVQYAPFIGDEKRDYVEYTSEAFLSQLHTMVTYTRCADSVLCAPLYIDVCCLLDYFARQKTSPATVAEATSYLFKVPEGRSGPVVGFTEQLRALENALDGHEVEAQEVIEGPRILCCGLACLDVELGGAQDGPREAINGFGEASSKAGGAAPQTASCLADHGVATSVVAALGDDAQGDELRSLLEDRGCHVDETLGKGRTGLAIVPVFVDGRGCYFAAGANAEFNAEQLVQGVERAVKAGPVSAVLVGYPHLLPALQEGLGEAFDTIRGKTDALIGVDLNGVQVHHYLGDGLVDAALYKSDVVHANADEAATLLRWPLYTYSAAQLARALADATGAACVLVTDGANGAAAAAANDPGRLAASKLPQGWPAGGVSIVAATPGPPGSAPNANGAGDAFFAAFCATTALHDVSLDEALAVAGAVACARVFDLPRRPLEEVVSAIRGGGVVS